MATVVLYPCSNFDNLGIERTENEAAELLAAWTAAFFPAILESDPKGDDLPHWESALYPPFNLANDTVIVPPCCETHWNEDWDKQTKDCLVIRNIAEREKIVQAILQARSISEHSYDADLIENCFALGLAKLMTDLLACQLHYIMSMDDSRQKTALFDALRAYRNNSAEETERLIRETFEEICQIKDNYYPIQNYFVELTLATETTIGESLRKVLLEKEQVNLFIPTNVLETLPEKEPATFDALKTAVEKSKVQFIFDDKETLPLELLPILNIADRLLEAVSLYRDLLNITPAIYGRQHIGLNPLLPQLLKRCGVKGAIHFAPLDGWKLDDEEQSKMIWQGVDGTNLDALIRYPVDVSGAKSFFDFVDVLGRTLNQDHAPTTVFALFAGQTSPYLDLLRRVTKYADGLGKFMDIEGYFNTTSQSGGVQQLGWDKYPKTPHNGTDKNPLSQYHTIYQDATRRLTDSAMKTVSALIGVEQFCDLFRQDVRSSGIGEMIVNPLSFSRRCFVNDEPVDVPPVGYTFVANEPPKKQEQKEYAPTGVSLPSALLQSSFLKTFWKPKKEQTLIHQTKDNIGKGIKRAVYLLENAYFSVKFDAKLGILRSIFTNRSRFNQLSRQLAFRQGAEYTIPSADEITILQNTSNIGVLQIEGRLIQPNGSLAARYCETITVRRQSRLLDFDLSLKPADDLILDDDSYFAVRYAWNDNTFDLRGGIADGTFPGTGKLLYCPKFIDLRNTEQSLTFFSEGLPLHRKVGERQLDTLLIIPNETQRRFRLVLAVNAKRKPAILAQDFLYSTLPAADNIPVSQIPPNPSAWLFQIESNSVVALHWETLFDDETEKPVGLTAYLYETEGKRASFSFRFFKPPVEASVTNLLGEEMKTPKIKDDAVLIDMHAYELLPLSVWFEQKSSAET
ncbi:hypothetical protein FACS189454_05710 [Planctomycetales bacterium]|nr:hypothetical protein FACS189454_05710 [Planctomycetales bacterium]